MEAKSEGGMLTAAEAEIMTVVWEIGSVVVQDIVERIPRELAYTTVMTTVRILEEKGFLRQAGKRGRAFMYEAAVDRESASESMAHEVARRLFGGSVKSLVLNLVRDDSISGDDLAEVKRIIEQLESKQ